MNELRSVVRNWLLKHPTINPYKWFDSGFFRTMIATLRVLPDFIIIGVQKGGTSSFYYYLIDHPNIFPALRKESHFFDRYLGRRFYRSYFPTIFTKFYIENICKKKFVTGEATPDYIFFPYCAKNIFKTNPNVKIILLLRNPVDRAFSHYQMKVRRGQEAMSFHDGIKSEEKRLKRDDSMTDEEYYNKFNFGGYSYLSRSRYVEQIKIWMEFFKNEQFLIIKTEDFEKNEQEILNKVYKFLELPIYTNRKLERKNVGHHSQKMEEGIRKELNEYFKPFNDELSKFLNMNFDWK